MYVVKSFTGRMIVILNVEEVRAEESFLQMKIGDGVHWWSGVILGQEMFPYYKHSWYKRGRQFTILYSHMSDNCLVIVSLFTKYLFTTW